ncbi:uncharacterized protein LOC124112266 [Haliotis rufescens]|uniref:uncharacterized protein LOC124112266 n=1 Tax=Haliotis rufescens TaxID=6454 RepID=UPI001EB06705|nr:uncharacterized protein LOC124112266 [Haliotis rufescens]XP_046328250.1 uncharacterized protein LOC124112266 [Haliotis rufescens]XP_048242539.1 uncharacterized protein LOC124112266 [Haliotis rufescens]
MSCNTLLTIAVWTVLVVLAVGCDEQCTSAFQQRLAEAAQGGNASSSLQRSCEAIKLHLQCLGEIRASCNANQIQMVNSTIATMQANYDRSCTEGSAGAEVDNCGARYVVCNEKFNATFFPALNAYDLTAACGSLNNYTACVESLLTSSDCSQYAGYAVNTINGIRTRYSSTCQGDTATTGANMARCLNGTMECFTTFNRTFFPSVRKSDMRLMCSSVSNYSKCINALAADTSCNQYTSQAVSSIQVLEQQHQVACGADGGAKATACLRSFRDCYQHFNETFNPAVQAMNIEKLCESMDEYKVCSVGIPDDCDKYLGQSIDGLDRMQAQYSQYCTPENKMIFGCSPLSKCNRNLIGNLTVTGAESGMLCMVLETYFPCVDEAVKQCQLSGDGISAISFRDLGLLSSRYCRSVLANPAIKSCMNFMQCHAALDLTNMSPSMMVEGTYWCHYMESSLICSSQLINAGHCNVRNRNDMINNIQRLRQMQQTTCTITTPAPTTSTTTAMKTTEPLKEDLSKKDDDKKQDKVTGNSDSASTLTLSFVTLALTFLVTIFHRHS